MSRIYYPQARAIMAVTFDGFAEKAQDSLTVILPALPISATVHRNSYHQADSWEATFDARDLPVDPAQIRAGQMELFLFQVPSIDDSQRVTSRANTGFEYHGNQPRTTEDANNQEGGLGAAREKFLLSDDRKPSIAGLFDDVSVEYSSSGRWVTISGQDYTALLAAKQYPPKKNGSPRRIPAGGRLDTTLQSILRAADDTGKLNILVEGIDKKDFTTEIPNVAAGWTRANAKRGIPIEADTSYWDVMYKLALRHGFILFVRGIDVVLTRPQNLELRKPDRLRVLAFGSNVEQLDLNRHLGKETAPTIVINYFDRNNGEKKTIDYPKGNYRNIRRSEGKKDGKPIKRVSGNEDYQIIPANGVTDPAVLQRMAQVRYHIIGRGERRARVRTRDFKDLKDENLLDLGAGDAVIIDFKEFNIDRGLLANSETSNEQRFHHLLNRGYSASVARTVADNYSKLFLLQRPLRVNEVTYEYSADDGISIEMELMDFIVVDGIRDPDQKETRTDTVRKKLSKTGSTTKNATRRTRDN